MNLLPVEIINPITSYLPIKALDAYSRTCQHMKNHCVGIARLKIYKSALRAFNGLKEKCTLRCAGSEVSVPKNVFVGTLKDNSIHFEAHSAREFECLVGYLWERSEYFVPPDTTDIHLGERQFIVSARLGEHFESDVEVPDNVNFLARLYFRHINPDTCDLVRTVTYPIKDFQCDFKRTVGISFDEVTAIQAAAKNVSEPELSSVSSFSF